ncbi:wd repeat protein [Stylonychia lemnae]|uniref:Dynein axonemal intermediate chain 4 n=1 Tax=Stylonychia lemnae TaxID=5949 RepID=A0A078AHR9_STYLE|nr:wd repeat protein [Stylonychia lemnae]|eukprot:CDW80368.1 wd repeat protein [Stylonychia lemnae]
MDNQLKIEQISCVDINPSNQDLIAVGYGEFDIDCTQSLKKGYLCFWSLKNPRDSQSNIAIFNILSPDSKSIANSNNLEGKHFDIVWEVKWIERGEKEILVSISGDGGLSIEFPQSENGINYFAATEENIIYRCSTLLTKKYQAVYYGHTGAVNRLRCNPFWDSIKCPVFITCSYDWTDQVNDIMWSPNISSVFASVANDGRIEIWDIFKDNQQPQLTYYDRNSKGNYKNTPKSVIKFSNNRPLLITGNIKGSLDIYRLYGLNDIIQTKEDQIQRLLTSIQKNDLQ